MSFAPYINFQGQCDAALTFYARVFSTSAPEIMRFKDMPPDENMPPIDPNWVMHGVIRKGGFALAASDVPDANYRAPQGISIQYSVASFNEGQVIFDALSEDGKVVMPFEPAFFSEGFGLVHDQFGISWIIAVGDL